MSLACLSLARLLRTCVLRPVAVSRIRIPYSMFSYVYFVYGSAHRVSGPGPVQAAGRRE